MRKLGMIILGIALFGLLRCNVYADDISYKRLNNIYYNLTVDGVTTKNHVTAFYLDGRLAYCIEPGKAINTKTYNQYQDWGNINLTDEQTQTIEKIGYYGYEYPNHQTDYYYIATQELIWKAIKNVDIKWTDSNGQVIDITAEKNEIQSLIDKHSIIPSFTGETIVGKKGEVKTIVDENSVLSEFEVSNGSSHSIEQNGNTITITFSDNIVSETISLSRKKYDNKTLLVYQYPNSQSLAALRLSYTENLSFNVTSEEETKEVVKVPSTSIEKLAIHFNNYKFGNMSHAKFS